MTLDIIFDVVLYRERMVSQHDAQPTSHEWVGLYNNLEDAFLQWVVSARYFKEFSFGPQHFNAKSMGSSPKSRVGSQYFTLMGVKVNVRMRLHLQPSHDGCHGLGLSRMQYLIHNIIQNHNNVLWECFVFHITFLENSIIVTTIRRQLKIC